MKTANGETSSGHRYRRPASTSRPFRWHRVWSMRFVIYCFVRISLWRQRAVPDPTKPKSWRTSTVANTYGKRVSVSPIRRRKIPSWNSVAPNCWNCCCRVSVRRCIERPIAAKSRINGLRILRVPRIGMRCHCSHRYWTRCARTIRWAWACRTTILYLQTQPNRWSRSVCNYWLWHSITICRCISHR